MNKSIERIIARGGSYISRAAVAAGPLGDWYIGSENSYFHKVGFYLARTTASMIDPEDWAQFDGDPSVPRNRKKWVKTGVVLGRASVLDAYTHADEDLVRAVGWRYGEAVLVGKVPYRTHEHISDSGNYEVGLRIGPEALVAAHGILNIRTKEFSVPEHASAKGQVYESFEVAPAGLLGM